MMEFNLLDVVIEAFKKVALEESKNRKMWSSEFDITASLYKLVRPVVDLLPTYELYWNWLVKFDLSRKKGTYKYVDLVLAELEMKGELKKRLEAYPRIAIEVKWGVSRDPIENDAIKLKKWLTEKVYDYDQGDYSGFKWVGKGSKPDHALLFILDLEDEKDFVPEYVSFYKRLRKDYRPVKVIYSFPEFNDFSE